MADTISYKNIYGSVININGETLEVEGIIEFPKKIPKGYHSPEQELKNLISAKYIKEVIYCLLIQL